MRGLRLAFSVSLLLGGLFTPVAAELVALKVDVIVAVGGTHAALAAKQATRTLPIVFIAVPDPVTSGFVTSLARAAMSRGCPASRRS